MSAPRFPVIRTLAIVLTVFLSGCGDDNGEAGPGDTTPPAAVTDLFVAATGSSSATLTWTAPGDDGTTGTASEYDLRYSDSSDITSESDWASATQVSGEPVPRAAGMPETLAVAVLTGKKVFHFALKAADEVPNWSGLSNPASADVDVTPPAAVQDLAVTATTESSITLGWTSPGDDASTGTASQYDIRYSMSTITETNWNTVTQASGEPVPQPAGSTEEFVVTGLLAGTPYYVALKTADEVLNWSGLSTQATGITAFPLPDMVPVPAGTFTMGDGAAYCGIDVHEVTLTHAFTIGQYEVTNQEYRDALQWAYGHGHVAATSASVETNLDGGGEELVDLDASDCEISFSNGIFTVDPGKEDHPVLEVSWYGAAAYCDWLNLQEGLPRAYNHFTWVCNGGDPYGAPGYRLPTDAEWEYAAQYNDGRTYPWGDESPHSGRANYDNNVGSTAPVGSYPSAPASLGLYDMAGNVWEWCNDSHTCSLGTDPQTDPTGPGSGSYRVGRGGSYLNDASTLRRAGRSYSEPWNSQGHLGFRCARSQ